MLTLKVYLGENVNGQYPPSVPFLAFVFIYIRVIFRFQIIWIGYFHLVSPHAIIKVLNDARTYAVTPVSSRG